MPDIDLVIFDCDGVLVDSERITTRLLAEVVTELGWPMTSDDATTRFKGRDLHEIQAEVETQIGRVLGDGFIPGYRERMAEVFMRDGVPPIEGADALLAWLESSDTKHAVASNAPHEKMKLTLGRTGGDDSDWYTRFEGRRFSAYDIQKWKPDPALFLHAAQIMGATPDSCIVVEDSRSGISAASAAGMRSIGFADLTPARELAGAGATHVVETIADVVKTLRAWMV